MKIADKGEGVTRAVGEHESRTPSVLRRAFLGYKRADVVAALEEQRHQIARLAASVDRGYRSTAAIWKSGAPPHQAAAGHKRPVAGYCVNLASFK